MRSSFLTTRPRLRRALPWMLWALVAVIAIPLVKSYAGIGSSPAMIQARVASLAPMRTAHRLRISKILVNPGRRVEAGELLVQMDTAEIDADLAVARARLAYVEITAGWQQLRLLGDQARTSHELASSAEHAAIEAARIVAEAERDRSELAQLDVNLAAEQRLVSGQLANSERLKALQLQRAALSKKVQEYQTAVARVRASANGSSLRLGRWSKEAEDVRPAAAGMGDPFTDVRSAARKLQLREIARLELERSRLDVRAPFDGRIGEVLQQVGDLSADPGIPVLTLVEERSNTAVAYLAQSDAKRIRVGDAVRLVPRNLASRPLTGRVTALAPNITEGPVRFRHVPSLQEFVRNAYIQLDAPSDLPGEAFDAVFTRGGGGT